MSDLKNVLREYFYELYGEGGLKHIQDLLARLEDFKQIYTPKPDGALSEMDVVLITYGDMVKEEHETPLRSLRFFMEKYFSENITSAHILPFYPYSSDDGFSVIDYRAVDPALGGWNEITEIGNEFRLMFDAVINHVSAKSLYFQGYLNGDDRYENFFIDMDPDTDLSKVFRPRSTPLLTDFDSADGKKHVWTTFSADQIDLNYGNPAVLVEMIDVLLFLVNRGARMIRLDAVTYVWKDLETSCANLPKTHLIIQLLRTVLNEVAPNTLIVTETNVPHKENIAYFGDGTNEAQMVYNFALPPLVLHSFISGNAAKLSAWAKSLALPSDKATFFNFLASHDGIGVTPVRGILDESEIEHLLSRVSELGGRVSYKDNGDGSKSAYELNINYLSALDDPRKPGESEVIRAKRFLAAQSIMLALRGVPGIYFHSLIGSENDQDGVARTGAARSINREKLALDRLERELLEHGTIRHLIYNGYQKLLAARKERVEFDPYGKQQVLDIAPEVFGLVRGSADGASQVLCLHNVTGASKTLRIAINRIGFSGVENLIGILTGRLLIVEDGWLNVTIEPYDVMWLVPS